ncbi:MAG: hypothetical protein AAF401_14160 [Pseudomonadota bacterium]
MDKLKYVVLAALAAALAACAPPPKRTATTYDSTVKRDCYTVDLFTEAVVEPPAEDVPAEWKGFSGVWGGGAWEGKWCHDLYVLSIDANGQVTVIETHGPFEDWGREATAFRRQGYITDKGRLRLIYSNVSVEYELAGDKLHGRRKEGAGEMLIKLSPKV